MPDYIDRFNPKYNADLIERFERFPLLAQVIRSEGNQSIRPLLGASHRTTALLSSMVTAHYFDGHAGGVDVIDLLRRLDAANKAAFLAWLGAM